jgi:outer membrane protein TolC
MDLVSPIQSNHRGGLRGFCSALAIGLPLVIPAIASSQSFQYSEPQNTNTLNIPSINQTLSTTQSAPSGQSLQLNQPTQPSYAAEVQRPLPNWASMALIEQHVAHASVFEGAPFIRLSLPDLIERTFTNSIKQREIILQPTETRQQINREFGTFDPAAFVRSQFDVQNLQTKQEDNSVAFGVKKNHRYGGTLELNETLGVQDNLGALAIPDQGVASLNMIYSQEVLRDGGRVVALSRGLIASFRYDEEYARALSQSNQLFEKVLQSYWQLYRARANYFIQRSLTVAAWELLQQIEERSNQLERAINSLEQARALYLEARGDLVDAQTRVQQSQDALFRLVNDPALDPLHTEIFTVEAPTKLDSQLEPWFEISEAVQYRPEVRERLAAIQQNSVEEQVSLNQILPKLTFSIRSSLNGFENDRDYRAALSSLDQLPMSAAASANMEMFLNNRTARARNKEAQIRASRLMAAYEDQLQLIREEVLQSLRVINNGPEKLDLRRLTLLTREREVNAIVDKIWVNPDEGVSIVNQLEQLFQAINRLVRTQQQVVEANIEIQTSLVSLMRAKGVLVSAQVVPRDIEIDIPGPLRSTKQLIEKNADGINAVRDRVIHEPRP